MSANVESMFSAENVVPWHGLGTIIKDPVIAADAITLAGLDWSVEKRPIWVPSAMTEADLETNEFTKPSEWVATVRTDTQEVLGIVGRGYQVVQNLEAFDFMDSLVGPGRLLQYHTAGSLAGGRKIWMLATVTDLVMEPVPGDIVKPYLLLANGHDGRLELSIAWTSVRVVCQNTLMMALSGARDKFAIRHVGDMEWKKETAQQILGLTQRVAKESEELYKKLTLKQMGDQVFKDFLKNLLPDPEDAKATRAENIREEIFEIYQANPGDITGVLGTAWGALNAVTAYTSHVKKPRGTKGNETLAAEKRTESVWWGTGNTMNQKALKLLVAL